MTHAFDPITLTSCDLGSEEEEEDTKNNPKRPRWVAGRGGEGQMQRQMQMVWLG